MAHARQPLSPCLRERGQIIFQNVIPFPLLATTSSLPFFFSFFFFLLFSSSRPFFRPRPPNHADSIPWFVRSAKGGERGEGMGWIVAVAGFWELVYFFFLSSFFSFFRSLFLYGARITEENWIFATWGRAEVFVIHRSNDRSISVFASWLLLRSWAQLDFVHVLLALSAKIKEIVKGSRKRSIPINSSFRNPRSFTSVKLYAPRAVWLFRDSASFPRIWICMRCTTVQLWDIYRRILLRSLVLCQRRRA